MLPQGAITFEFRTVTFKVPPGGSRTTRQSFVIGTTDAGVLAKSKANEDRLV